MRTALSQSVTVRFPNEYYHTQKSQWTPQEVNGRSMHNFNFGTKGLNKGVAIKRFINVIDVSSRSVIPVQTSFHIEKSIKNLVFLR